MGLAEVPKGLRLVAVLLLVMVLAVLASLSTPFQGSAALAPMAPPSPPATYQYNVQDCSGLDAQGYSGSNPVVEGTQIGPKGLPCQSYGLDLYENLEYGAAGTSTRDNAQCADIEWFRVGSDATWIYLEWDQVSRNPSQCGSHVVAVEFDVDASSESLRSDYVIYGGSVNCAEGTWTDGKNIGWQGYFDSNNNVGGANPGTGATCTSPIDPSPRPLTKNDLIGQKFYEGGADGCSDKYDADQSDGVQGDGYNADNKLDGGDLVYCRWDGDKLHVAVKKSYVSIASSDPDVRVRGWSDQQTSFDKAKFYEHDWKDPDFLGSDRRDNVDWTSGDNPNAIDLRETAATRVSNFFALGLVFMIAVAAVLMLVLRLRQRRSSTL